MQNVLDIIATPTPLAVGFRKQREDGPDSRRWVLYLPDNEASGLISYGQLVEIVEVRLLDRDLFSESFDYITIHDGPYSKAASIFLAEYMADFPMTDSCRLNVPARFVFGEGLC